MNSKERLQRVLESLLVSYGGAWMAWFVSFMAGSLVSAVLGSALIFNWMYTPWLNAKRRNVRIYPASPATAYHAVFLGRISSLRKVRRRAGKTIGAVSQEFLAMTIRDESQRELEIVTQWQPPYARLRVNMQCPTIIASADAAFDQVFVVTDAYVPACDCLVGDYPYLQKKEFAELLAQIRARGAGRAAGRRSVGGGEGEGEEWDGGEDGDGEGGRGLWGGGGDGSGGGGGGEDDGSGVDWNSFLLDIDDEDEVGDSSSGSSSGSGKYSSRSSFSLLSQPQQPGPGPEPEPAGVRGGKGGSRGRARA